MAITKVINDLIDLNATDATKSLKMPSGAAYSGTTEDGMVRNSSEAQSQSSTNVMQHFNGTDWKNYENLPIPIVFDTTYLILGGGGGGGGWGGGGGAGGYLTNYLGTAISLTVGVTYTVTVGIGGTEATNPGNAGRIIGTNGGDSILSGTGLTTITSAGGGAGGTAFAATLSPGQPGGSGGGADSTQTIATTGGAGNTPATTPSQGFAGGDSGVTSGNYPGGGGGGGAAATGGSSTGTPPYTPGDGGNGLPNNIDGLGLTYAGGGGGFYYGVGGSRSTGGTGGGGAGGQFDAGAADGGAGTDGLGGGGGSGAAYTGAPYTSASGPGGRGVIILRYPSARTAVYTAGSGGAADAQSTVGSDNFIRITAGTGTITFS